MERQETQGIHSYKWNHHTSTNPSSEGRFRKAQPEDNTDSLCVRYFIEVPRPSIVEHYFNTANAIDVHNHLRQGGLELERRWRTQTWWHWAFATVITICEADAYLAFLYFHPNKAVTVNPTHEKFTSQLCMQLLQFDSERIDGPCIRASTTTPVRKCTSLALIHYIPKWVKLSASIHFEET